MATTPNSIRITRVLFVIICELLAVTISLIDQNVSLWIAVLLGCVFAGFVIYIESLLKGFTLRGFSTATFGLLVGLFCAWLVTRVGATRLILEIDRFSSAQSLQTTLDAAIYASLGFLGAILALRSDRDDFAFIIPYVRFREDATSGQAMLLDLAILMDGRVPKVLEAGGLNGRLVVPRFVIDRLQETADSPEGIVRAQALRGLECLEQLRLNGSREVHIHDSTSPDQVEDGIHEMIHAARILGARLLTVDDRLSKVAKLQGVHVLNLNELSDSLRPGVVVGEKIRIALVKQGKDDNQAVGYLADGTMIVVNQAVAKIGQTVDAIVISKLQTASGQMVFAELSQ